MELIIAHLVNLLLVSVFVGTEFTIGFFVHPVLIKLPPSVHIASAQAIGQFIGKIMPVWIPLIIVSALPILYFTIGEHTLAFWFTVSGTICVILMLIVSLAVNVPINKKVIEWNPQLPPGNWQKLRNRWDSFHQLRILLDFAALLFFLLSALV